MSRALEADDFVQRWIGGTCMQAPAKCTSMQAYPPRCTCMYICVHAYVDMGAIYVLIYRCRNNICFMHTSICAQTSGGAFASPALPPPKRCPVCLQLKLHYDCHIEAGSLLTSATPGCVAFAGPEKGRFKRRIIAEVPIRFRFGFPSCLLAHLCLFFRERTSEIDNK